MSPSQRLSDVQLDFSGLPRLSLDVDSLSWPSTAQASSVSAAPFAVTVPAAPRPGAHRAGVPTARRASLAASLAAALLVAGMLASTVNGPGGAAAALAGPATPIGSGTIADGAKGGTGTANGPFVAAAEAGPGTPHTPAAGALLVGSPVTAGTTVASPSGAVVAGLAGGGGVALVQASRTSSRPVLPVGGHATPGRPGTPHPPVPHPPVSHPSVPHPSTPRVPTPHVPAPQAPTPAAPKPPAAPPRPHVPHVPVFTPPKRITIHFPLPIHLPSGGDRGHGNGHGSSRH